MPLMPVPQLDDRTFDDLVAELVARIPAHTPEWTHPRVGDPGRTLIDLFAWLGDALLYRANLIPERQRLAFLRLLDIPLRPAVPAAGLVSLSFSDENETGAAVIRANARLDGPVVFETATELTVLPVTAVAFAKRPLTPAEETALDEVIQGLETIYQTSGRARPYATTPIFAGGLPEPDGFDLVRDSVDQSLWLALLAPAEAHVAAVRATLGRSAAGTQQLLTVGVAPEIAVPALFEEIGPRARIPHVWQMTGVDPAGGQTVYHDLEVVADTTAGLTKRGTQRLLLPAASNIGAPTNDVRQRLSAGVGQEPPRLDDEALTARLVTWLRLRPDAALSSLSLSWAGVNATGIVQLQTFTNRLVGQSSGAADQRFELAAGTIDPTTFELQVEEAGQGYRSWSRIEDLALAGRDDAVFELDGGSVRFGDGVRGRIPAAGARLRVATMRVGGGAAGNLPAGTLQAVTARDLDNRTVALAVSQPLPTHGGEDAETLDAAERRLPATLRHRERAVTAEDYRLLVGETPGVRVGRVEVLPRFKPQQRREGVPGVVSVMALPHKGTIALPNPRPDRPFLETIHAYLDARRPLGTELYAIGCEYVPLGVSVNVTLAGGFNREEVLQAVREALRAALWPLAPGGPEGAGWPLGRTVRDRELEVAVARVEGVSEVAPLNLFVKEGANWKMVKRLKSDQEPVQVTLDPWQLPELLSLLVVSDPGAGSPGDLSPLPNPFASEDEVAVPVVPEMC